MEKTCGMTDTILLLDTYDESAAMLRQSFRSAGFKGPVIVIEDDGFFPEDVLSAYQYFCGSFRKKGRKPGKARYFNQIECPDYWEISGNGVKGKVKDLYRERGRIFYSEPKHSRLVKVVDWMDEYGTVRFSDHYNRYGALYARTIFNKDAKRFCKAYFDAEGREVLLENLATHDIILNRDGKVYIFRSKVELVLKMLEELGLTECRIFFNSLSTPLFVSERMPKNGKEDVLFWQEGPRDDIPGNMQMIFSGKSDRVKKIYVQKQGSYEKLLRLGAPAEYMERLGFVYPFVRQNSCQNEALICTNSDRIEQCEELIQALPQMRFHIAAITEMSSKLLDLSRYKNVETYPNVKMARLRELFEQCDYYLDINHESEIVSAVKQAFLNNQLIVGFEGTLHNRTLLSDNHIFSNYKEMSAFLNKLMGHKEKIKEQLALQKQAAVSEEAAAYAALFGAQA